LREGAQSLINSAGEIDNLVSRTGGIRQDWRLVEDQLAALSEHFGLGYDPPRRGRWSDSERGRVSGRFRWEGRVDGNDELTLRGDRVSIRHLANNPITDDGYDFVEPLPRRPVNVRLTKLAGRGRVDIVEQPSGRNGWSVKVLIEDPEGGSDVYRFELDW